MNKLNIEDLKDIAEKEVERLIRKKLLKKMNETLTNEFDNLYTVSYEIAGLISEEDYTEEIYAYLEGKFKDYS